MVGLVQKACKDLPKNARCNPEFVARLRSGNAHLTFPVLLSKFWDLRTSSSQPNFDSDFCLAGVPLRMTFANYESTFSKLRVDKNKTTNPFGQTMKRCLTAAGATFQNYEAESPDYEQRFSNYDWRSSTWNSQTTNRLKILLRNQNSRGQRTTTKLRSARAYSTLRVQGTTRAFSQIFTEFCRNPQKTADRCLSP